MQARYSAYRSYRADLSLFVPDIVIRVDGNRRPISGHEDGVSLDVLTYLD